MGLTIVFISFFYGVVPSRIARTFRTTDCAYTVANTQIMSCPAVKLVSGFKMPLVGLGTRKSKPGKVQAAVLKALEAGYRHIDAAAIYGNETEVGVGIKSAIERKICKREDIFVTSKLWNTEHDPKRVKPALEKTLKDLGLG